MEVRDMIAISRKRRKPSPRYIGPKSEVRLPAQIKAWYDKMGGGPYMRDVLVKNFERPLDPIKMIQLSSLECEEIVRYLQPGIDRELRHKLADTANNRTTPPGKKSPTAPNAPPRP
jgi:hypothetical protein